MPPPLQAAESETREEKKRINKFINIKSEVEPKVETKIKVRYYDNFFIYSSYEIS